MAEPGVPDRLMRWSVAVAVVLAVALPLTTLALASSLGADSKLPQALTGTLLYLPIHGWLIWHATLGRRAPFALPLLVVEAVIIVGALPFVGAIEWSPAFGSLALAALIVLPVPWSLLAYLVLVGVQFPLASEAGSTEDGVLAALLVSKALAAYAMLSLLAAARKLDATRALLANRAVAQERIRMDRELRRTIGADLAEITAQGDRVAAHPDLPAAEEDLQRLVTRSRLALARARRLISGFARPSLRTELDTAVSLLRASGTRVRVVGPREFPEDADTAAARDELRALTARLLRDGRTAECVITTSVADGRVALAATAGASVVSSR